jgi:signal peptidase I
MMDDDKRPTRKSGWLAELRFLLFLGLGVFAFQGLAAKPFYIPSESMMPTLMKGDRLIATRYPYGWSYASLPIHLLGYTPGRLFGRTPERGDVVIVVRRGNNEDLIKRVIGLPGDRIAVHHGIVSINGKAVPRVRRPDAMIPLDANASCDQGPLAGHVVRGAGGGLYCRLPLYRETLPNGRSYDTIDLGDSVLAGGYVSPGDEFGPVTVPAGHLFLMGDNRDDSADSRFPLAEGGLGGPVPVETIGGRAEFITFSLDGTSRWYDPRTWLAALRGDRAGNSLRAT